MNLLTHIWSLLNRVDTQTKKNASGIEDLARLMKSNVEVAHLRYETFLSLLESIQESLKQVQADLRPPPAVSLEITIGGDVITGENKMLQVSDSGSVLASLEVQDAAGNPGAKLDSVPVWTVSDPVLGSVNASEDGLTAVVVLTGKLGTFKVSASAQAGDKTLSDDSDDIQVVVGAAALLIVDLAAK